MPLRYQIDRERRLLIATVIGDFTSADISAFIEAATNDPGFEPGFGILSDHSAVGTPISTPQVNRMVARLRRIPAVRGSRWAIVATQPASYGMMRMLSVLAERIPMAVRIFASRAEAEAWLLGGR